MGDAVPDPTAVFQSANSNWWEGGQKVKTGTVFSPRRLNTPLDKILRQRAGRRSMTRTQRKRGRYTQSKPAMGKADDLAFDATIRAAAPFQNRRAEQRKKVAFAIQPQDYMRKIRVRRTANLILFVVDASWSMAVAERMAAAKGAILSLLNDAYQRRDRVGMIVFQKDRATLVLPPTNSVMMAQRALQDIPVGGKTPLSAGMRLAYEVLMREKITMPDVIPLMVLLTDGAGNVAMGSKLGPLPEAYQISRLIAEEDVHSVVINLEHPAFDRGLAQALADNLLSPCYSIEDLQAESLYQAVKQEISLIQQKTKSV
ncbi:MAG: VWA domain-containing protein [Anaerolineaceae bacterium]|jgi:magnesium chelatase subunit D|nr:VWA domain-containing protein [Anaerolineaceae bacterium]